jgi:multiple sugar transport system permease protein
MIARNSAAPLLAAAGPPAVRGRVGVLARRERRVAYLLLAPALLVLIGLSIFPTVFSATLSFRVEPLYNPNVARFVGWRNYNDLFEDERFRRSIRLTLLWSVIVVSIQMALGLFMAILLDRKMRGVSVLRTLIIVPVFISPIAMGLTWRFIFEPVSGLTHWLLTQVGLDNPWLSDKETALSTLMVLSQGWWKFA